MSICVEIRGGIRMMLEEDAKLPPEMVKDINDYHAECRLLEIITCAGYLGKYSLDANSHPVSLEIVIPAGKDKGGYPDKDEHLTIRPHLKNDGTLILTVGFELTPP